VLEGHALRAHRIPDPNGPDLEVPMAEGAAKPVGPQRGALLKEVEGPIHQMRPIRRMPTRASMAAWTWPMRILRTTSASPPMAPSG